MQMLILILAYFSPKKDLWLETGSHDPLGVTVAGQCLIENHRVELVAGARIDALQGQHLVGNEIGQAAAKSNACGRVMSGPSLIVVK